MNTFYHYFTILSILCWIHRVAWCQEKRKKTEVLTAIFVSVFNTRTSCPQDTQLPELEVIGPTVQEEMASANLLCKLDNHPTMGLNGANPRVMKELSFISSPGYLEKLPREVIESLEVFKIWMNVTLRDMV